MYFLDEEREELYFVVDFRKEDLISDCVEKFIKLLWHFDLVIPYVKQDVIRTKERENEGVLPKVSFQDFIKCRIK